MHLNKNKNRINSNSVRQNKSKRFLGNSIYSALETYIKHRPKHNKQNITNITSPFRNNKINSIENESLIIDKEVINPLSSLYTNTFYPHSYKNKNYIKELQNCLPPITMASPNNYYKNKIKDILSADYEKSISKFNNVYKNNGEEIINILDRIDDNLKSDEDLIEIAKKNEINIDESLFISNVLKDNKKYNKDCSVKLHKEDFLDPKNSLLTIKINNELINNIKDASLNYQYDSYVDKINENQKNRLKLFIMPKANIKPLKFHQIQLNKQKQNNFKKHNKIENKNAKKVITIGKNLIKKISKKINDDKSVKNNDNDQQESDEEKETFFENNEAVSIGSTVIRNVLINEVTNYYCKYLAQNNRNPASRMNATFTPYYNNLFLFGGLQTKDESDLWRLDIRNKVYSWKKINFSNKICFNPRYGHTCVAFNDCLYIYGGYFNLKKIKYPLEDILIYNMNSNTMKIGVFKNDKSKNYINSAYKCTNVPQRRNHIAHVIGWNMIIYGGIDISKEYFNNYVEINENNNSNPNEEKLKTEGNISNNNNHILGDFLALDLYGLRWMNLTNIVYKVKSQKKILKIKRGIPRVYHSSCLVLSEDCLIKGNKLNIYKNYIKKDETPYSGNMRQKFEIKYEGIYIFGGINENLKETNTLFILHCFRNPLVFFEPKIMGAPPPPRQMASMNFNRTLNFITIYGGKDNLQIFGDLYILDIMNFQWLKIELFGGPTKDKRVGHCSGIIDDKLYIFGGCDENNKYPSARVLCVELDLLRNKKLFKIYDFAKSTLEQTPKDRTAKNVLELIQLGAELPSDIYPFLQLDDK